VEDEEEAQSRVSEPGVGGLGRMASILSETSAAALSRGDHNSFEFIGYPDNQLIVSMQVPSGMDPERSMIERQGSCRL
jgi:hypothetical protein